MLNYLSLSNLIITAFVLINIPLSIIVYRNNQRSWTNTLFSLLIFSLTVYIFVNTQTYAIEQYSVRLFFARFIMANGAVINLLVFLFLTAFPNKQYPIKNRIINFCAVLSTLILFVVSFTPLIFKSINISSDNIVSPVPGVAMPLFLLHTLVFVIGGFVVLLRKRKKSESVTRIKINYILSAFGLLFFFVIIFNLFFPVVLGIGQFVPFLPIYILVFLAIVSYSLIKHQLFDTKVIATEVLTLGLWVVLLINLFTASDITELAVDGLVFMFSITFGILLIRSVINEVRQKEKLQELTEKLRALDKQKDEFLSMAAHELRAPLTAIKGYVSMVVSEDFGPVPSKAKEYLSDASSVNDRLIRLVNNMLNVSRIEEGRMVYNVGEIKLSEVINQIHASFKFEAERKGLTFTVSTPKSVYDKVKVDQDRIHEIVGNFVSNAVKYTDKGGITVTTSNPTKSIVRVEVKDTGTGISESEQVKLFKKFYRVESKVGKTIGTGLGLYISKLLVEKFGGKIGLHSEPEKGSTFWFEFPVVK